MIWKSARGFNPESELNLAQERGVFQDIDHLVSTPVIENKGAADLNGFVGVRNRLCQENLNNSFGAA